MLLGSEELQKALPAISHAKVLVCQLEISLQTSLQALRMAQENNGQWVSLDCVWWCVHSSCASPSEERTFCLFCLSKKDKFDKLLLCYFYITENRWLHLLSINCVTYFSAVVTLVFKGSISPLFELRNYRYLFTYLHLSATQTLNSITKYSFLLVYVLKDLSNNLRVIAD